MYSEKEEEVLATLTRPRKQFYNPFIFMHIYTIWTDKSLEITTESCDIKEVLIGYNKFTFS